MGYFLPPRHQNTKTHKGKRQIKSPVDKLNIQPDLCIFGFYAPDNPKFFDPETKTNMIQNLRPKKTQITQTFYFQINSTNAHNRNTRNMRVLGCCVPFKK